MATAKKSTGSTASADDIAAAGTAVESYFTAEVNRRQAELETALKALADAEARRAEIADGARMALGEYVAVHSAVQDPAVQLARDIIDGKSVRSKADVDEILGRADAVKRGLVALGYTEVELS